MTLKEIEKLIKDFEKSSLRELELEVGEVKLRLSKNENKVEQVIKTNEQSNEVKEEVKIEPTINYPTEDVKSPLVGTFYAASSPDSDPFVNIGDHVKKGDPLCIIEAMKIMNEITAPISGIIEKINFENGDVVGFNDAIMVIKKDGN